MSCWFLQETSTAEWTRELFLLHLVEDVVRGNCERFFLVFSGEIGCRDRGVASNFDK